jgi:hypothetical protein
MPHRPLKLRLLLLSALLLSHMSVAAASRADGLVGEWYRGGGKGDDISLVLRPDFTYDAAWTDSRGVYATATGSWRISGSQVMFAPVRETGTIRSPLDILDVVPSTNDLLLLAPRDRRRFIWGPDPHRWCFTRS